MKFTLPLSSLLFFASSSFSAQAFPYAKMSTGYLQSLQDSVSPLSTTQSGSNPSFSSPFNFKEMESILQQHQHVEESLHSNGALPFHSYRGEYIMSLMDGGVEYQQAFGKELILSEFTCDGMVYDHKTYLGLQQFSGEAMRLLMEYNTFETTDHSFLRFKTETRGSSQSISVGKAERQENNNIVVEVNQFDPKTLPPTTFFPYALLEELYYHSFIKPDRQVGDTQNFLFFDGGNQLEYNELFIMYQEEGVVSEENHKLLSPTVFEQLKGLKYRRIHKAFFLPHEEKDLIPDFHVTFDLYENGITNNLILNFHNFIVKSELIKLSTLTTANCPPSSGAEEGQEQP